MRIAFHSEQLDRRGSSVVLSEYAKYNQLLLGNESFFVTNAQGNMDGLEGVRSHFPVFLYDNFGQAEQFVRENKIDVVYYLKAGINDGKLISGVKNVIHSVFWFYDPHGDVYAYVSPWLAQAASNGRNTFVPHIITMNTKDKGDYREFLNIPQDALVLGYMGGTDSFKIDFAREAVYEIAKARKDIYFLFMNSETFGPKMPNVIHVEGTTDIDAKAAFINTCDVCFHARDGGETFGMTIGEFAVNNKPILTYGHHTHRAHIEFLGDKGIYYWDKENLIDIITHMNREELANRNNLAYTEFTPENVMPIFDKVFLK